MFFREIKNPFKTPLSEEDKKRNSHLIKAGIIALPNIEDDYNLEVLNRSEYNVSNAKLSNPKEIWYRYTKLDSGDMITVNFESSATFRVVNYELQKRKIPSYIYNNDDEVKRR